ncbi:GDSL esterase/lipase At3g48460 [Pyrus x bretschneideri]|uniref:GDSL esterase/lipase At3g48460 n=1 Tax=Pyrus x bretschneideri TaxID=225117 RepID=UPI000511248E|nr:GDSL esterase/lipase At3g48460 [Pyrus x bretschneideri]
MASSSSPLFTSWQITLITLTTISFLSSSSFPASAAATKQNPTSPFKKIYAFGDSFTDTGNTRSITGPSGFGHVSNSPYGITFFHRPTNRYSDGRLVIDFVTESLSLPYLPPYRVVSSNASADSTHGVNFAVAGSTAIEHEFFVKNNLSLAITPQSILSQLLWFNKFLESKGCKVGGPECKFDDALFWVGEIGVNDYAYTIGSAVPGDTIQKLGVSRVTSFLQALLKKGAKYVVVQGLPLSGCLPLAMTLAPEDDRDSIGCVKSVNNQTYSHNLVLQAKLQELRKQFPHAVITYADYWNAHLAVMKNPSQYGFTESFKACCGKSDDPYNFDVFATCGTPSATACKSPSQYINWDGVHLTEAMYKVLSDMFLKGNATHPPFSSLLDMKLHNG